MKTETFIKKARVIHGDKYDYSKTDLEHRDENGKVIIICPEHGEFLQTPSSHLRGENCPKCANMKRGDTFRSNREEFIKRAKEKHGDKYDYSKVIYKNAETEVTVICPKHGEFKIRPMQHLLGQGCSKCAGRGLNTEELIERFRSVHGDKYDYSKVIFTKMHEPVTIICPEHGEFLQTPSKHYSKKQGCPKCAEEKKKKGFNKLTTEEFIEKAKQIHGDKYDYSKTKYTLSHDEVIITCPIHGDFKQVANYHLSGHGCEKCGYNVSNGEDEIEEFIRSLGFLVVKKDRTILDGKEIDIFIPEKKVGFEFDGLYWHSNEYKNDNYHLLKTMAAEDAGIRLVHIFEDEWYFKKEIVKSMISNILGKTERKIYARKCKIQEVGRFEKKLFLDKNHIQGDVVTNINIGLYYEGELVSLMCFGKRRVNLGKKAANEGEYELLRFCNLLNTSVIGGASKLFKYFIENKAPEYIISYCDRRYSVGNMYEKIGLTKSHISKPNYFYVQGVNRENRFKFRKSELVKDGYDPDKSEREIMKERNIPRIYDCGNIVYEWKKPE